MIDLDALAIGPCMAVFGQPCTLRSSVTGIQASITGVFDEAYRALQPLGDLGSMIGQPGYMTGSLPVLGVQLSTCPLHPAQGDTVMIAGLQYVIREVQPDGHGWAKLMLNLNG